MLRLFSFTILHFVIFCTYCQHPLDSLGTVPNANGLTAVTQRFIDYYQTDDIDSVKFYTDRLRQIALNNEDESLQQLADLQWAKTLAFFNYTDSAEKVIEGIIIKDKITHSIEHNLVVGLIERNRRNFDVALTHLYKALEDVQQHNPAMLAFVYTEIAFILSQNNDLENCKKYYGYAFEEASKNKDHKLLVDICYKLCRVYNGGIQVNLDSSIHYGELGIQIAKASGYERGYANMINVVAAPIIRKGQYRRGLEMSKEALRFSSKYNFSLQTQYYLILNQGFAYEKLGLYDSAILKMEEGGALRPMGIDHHRLKYLIYKSKKDFSRALPALEIYEFKKDSIIQARNETNLSSLQARLEADIKAKEVESLTQQAQLQSYQLSQQRYLLLALGLLVLLIVGGGIFLYRQRQLKQQQLITEIELTELRKRLDVEKQYRASELKALRSQMNPHFVFNALNSIQEYIVLNEKKLAGKYLGKFADLMRIYLNHSQLKSVSIQEEVEALALYLELEKLRFEESLTYEIKVDPAIDTHLISIPTLLIQPYVENALKHGLLHKRGDRILSVSFETDQQQSIVICSITDNGIGRTQSAEINKMRATSHKSFATEATKTRLELLNYNNANPVGEQVIDLYDEDGLAIGTKAILKIPVQEFGV